MDHIAIMKKSLKLLPKILSGEKTIESRWYMAKFAPWNKIKAGEKIYFKDMGEPVTVKAEVSKVLQFELTPKITKEIIENYPGIGLTDKIKAIEERKNKKYCILIFLENVTAIEPFYINKAGFGNACAWLCVDDINKIKFKGNYCVLNHTKAFKQHLSF